MEKRKDIPLVDYREIGYRIRMERRRRRLNQEELARLSGISCSHIGYIERGEKKPSIEILAILSKTLEMDLHYIVFGIAKGTEQTAVLKQEIQSVLDRFQ